MNAKILKCLTNVALLNSYLFKMFFQDFTILTFQFHLLNLHSAFLILKPTFDIFYSAIFYFQVLLFMIYGFLMKPFLMLNLIHLFFLGDFNFLFAKLVFKTKLILHTFYFEYFEHLIILFSRLIIKFFEIIFVIHFSVKDFLCFELMDVSVIVISHFIFSKLKFSF